MLKENEVYTCRRAFIKALKSDAHIQCKDDLGEYENFSGPVCFAGLFLRINYIEWKNCNNIMYGVFSFLTNKLGLPPERLIQYVMANDMGATFKDLARFLEDEQ